MCKIDAFLSWNFLISVSSISSSVMNRNEIISHELFIIGTIPFLNFLLKVLNEIKSKSCRIFLVLFTIISNRISQFDHYPNQSCMLSKRPDLRVLYCRISKLLHVCMQKRFFVLSTSKERPQRSFP